MRSFKIVAMLIVILIAIAAHVFVHTVEPEQARAIALEQLENSDHAAQSMRAYTSGKVLLYLAIDAMVPVAFLALFGGDILDMFRSKSVSVKGELQ